MRKTDLFLALACLLLVAVGGCGKGDLAGPPVPGGGNGGDPDEEVVVNFSAGAISTRGAFADGTPVKVLVYRRPKGSVKMNLSVAPHKTVSGTTRVSGALSGLVLAEGDLTDGKLLLKTGYTYDFITLVNPPYDKDKPSVGVINIGYMSGVPHGVDLLAGRKEGVAIAAGTPSIEIRFTDNGADADGNLPHLCSGVAIEARTTKEFIDFIQGKGSDLMFSIAGATFNRLPGVYNFPFSSDPFGLSPASGTYTTMHTLKANTPPVKITLPSDKVYYDQGVLLPYPLRTGATHNALDIRFILGVNGAEATLDATDVQLPAFLPGYRYKFIVEFEADLTTTSINLFLAVAPWDSLSWESGMGGDDKDYLFVKVGSWDNISWSSGMGGDDKNYLIVGVHGWSGVTWGSDMGGTNPDNGTNG